MTLQHRIVAFLKKYPSSTPEIAEIFESHPEHVRRVLQELRHDGLIVPTGKWDGKAPIYVASEAAQSFESPDVREYKRQVDEAFSRLNLVLYSRPGVPDVRIALRSIVQSAVAEIR